MTDKTKSKTYNFLSENKSIEDILKQPNTTLKEKRRHGGSTFKLIEKNYANHQPVNDDISENEIFYDALDNIDTEKISPSQILTKEIWTQTETTEEKSNINLKKYSYNVITTYDEKQRKNTGIEKIHEEILPIENKVFFITTLVHINQSITENIIFFQEDYNGDIQVINQIKNYKNINEYNKDISLIHQQNHNTNNFQFVPIKDFLKQQKGKKIKPSNKQWIIWSVFTTLAIIPIICAFLPFVWPAVTLVLIDKIAISAFLVTTGIGGKIFSSLFSPITKKVESWISNKICKNEEAKEKNKKEREAIIKNLENEKSETKLQTQYDILKQELDIVKDKNPKELINDETINHNSNNILENSSIESENNQNFDSSIRNTVNNQDSQLLTSSIKNWNKVKCLLTT